MEKTNLLTINITWNCNYHATPILKTFVHSYLERLNLSMTKTRVNFLKFIGHNMDTYDSTETGETKHFFWMYLSNSFA